METTNVVTALVEEYTSYFIERIHAFKSIKPIRGMRSLDCAGIPATHNLQDLKKFRINGKLKIKYKMVSCYQNSSDLL